MNRPFVMRAACARGVVEQPARRAWPKRSRALVRADAAAGCRSVDGRQPTRARKRHRAATARAHGWARVHLDDEIAATLATYGMGYQVHELRDDGDDKNIADCPQYFPASDRNVWHNFDGEFYYIDGSGRPQRAYKYLPPVSAAPRNETCQGNVGRWGDAANPSNNYDGGHLIAASLGGWGKRANLVPQDSNFNQGNWNQIEQQMAKCGGLSSQRMLYQVTLSYPNSSTLIPSSFGLFMQDRVQGDSVSLSFQNVDYGGSNGTSERQRAVSFLINNGCN